MTHGADLVVRVLVGVFAAFGAVSTLGVPLVFGLALRTIRVAPRRERVDVAVLDAIPCAIVAGTALGSAWAALSLDAARGGALVVALLALASAFRWRVRCAATTTEVARTFLGVPWRRTRYVGSARLEETGWGDFLDPAAIEVRVGAAHVAELCWILRNGGEAASRVIQRANAALERLGESTDARGYR